MSPSKLVLLMVLLLVPGGLVALLAMAIAKALRARRRRMAQATMHGRTRWMTAPHGSPA